MKQFLEFKYSGIVEFGEAKGLNGLVGVKWS
jgi:hypothetical protein